VTLRSATVLVAACAACLTASASAGSSTRLPGFRSPSGNISCLILGGTPATLLCKIAHADYAKELQARCMGPAGAGVDWHGFELSAARKGAIVCSGGALYPGTDRPSYVTVPYGKTWRQKMFSCSSRVTGVNCSNPNGHGFFLSRQTWRVW
jgi:uncharacterized protein DUF6636